MFGILRVNSNKTTSPLCYFSDEIEARKMFEGMSKATNVTLQLVDNFDPKITAMKFSNHTVLEESDPSKNDQLKEVKKFPVMKMKYRYEYISKQEKLEYEQKLKAQEIQAQIQQKQDEKQQKKINQEILKSKQTIGDNTNKHTGLPIDYYIKKPDFNTPVKRYLFYLVHQNSNLILVSELPWSLEYDINYFNIKTESNNINVEGYWMVECYAKNKTDAIKFCKEKIKEYFKKRKSKT